MSLIPEAMGTGGLSASPGSAPEIVERTGRLAGDGRVDGGASRDTDVASGGSLRGEELVGVAVTVRGAGGASQGSHGGGCESSLHGGDKIFG